MSRGRPFPREMGFPGEDRAQAGITGARKRDAASRERIRPAAGTVSAGTADPAGPANADMVSEWLEHARGPLAQVAPEPGTRGSGEHR